MSGRKDPYWKQPEDMTDAEWLYVLIDAVQEMVDATDSRDIRRWQLAMALIAGTIEAIAEHAPLDGNE